VTAKCIVPPKKIEKELTNHHSFCTFSRILLFSIFLGGSISGIEPKVNGPLVHPHQAAKAAMDAAPYADRNGGDADAGDGDGDAPPPPPPPGGSRPMKVGLQWNQ